MSDPDSTIVRAFGMNPKVGVQDIFRLENFDTLTRTPVRVLKMNVVARTQLTFQILNLLQKHKYMF